MGNYGKFCYLEGRKAEALRAPEGGSRGIHVCVHLPMSLPACFSAFRVGTYECIHLCVYASVHICVYI